MPRPVQGLMEISVEDCIHFSLVLLLFFGSSKLLLEVIITFSSKRALLPKILENAKILFSSRKVKDTYNKAMSGIKL